MPQSVKYDEGLPSVVIDDGTSSGIEAERGVPVTVPDEIATRLLEQGWTSADTAPPVTEQKVQKPAGKEPAAPTHKESV